MKLKTSYRKDGLKYRYVLTTIRTGSHLFYYSLIKNLKLNVKVKPIYLNPFEHDYYINDIFYINRIHTPSFLEIDLSKEKDVKILFLDRKDIIAQAISFYIADYISKHNYFWKWQLKTEVDVSMYKKVMKDIKIPFDKYSIKYIIDEWENNRREFYSYIKDKIPYQVFYYEDIMKNYIYYIKEAISFLFDYSFNEYQEFKTLYKTSTNLNKLFKLQYLNSNV